MRLRALPPSGRQQMGDSGGLGLQAQPFESHTESAQALSSSPQKRKKAP
jgi:hypothetical protein